MKKRFMGNAMLLSAAMIWGASFVAQTVGMDYVGPFTFQAVRCFLASLVLLPVIACIDRKGNGKKPVSPAAKKDQLVYGVLCGLVLFVACSLQQIGLQYVEAGKAGFITSLYIILVPIAGLLFGRKIKPWVLGSVLLALVGLYLLCATDMSIGKGELLILACAAAYTAHILIIDKVSARLDGVRLSCMQFFVVGIISTAAMFIWETPSTDGILQCWLPICYSGILSAGVGFTFQIIGQAHTEPTVASLLMSLESVFSMIFGWLLLNQRLSGLELFGCGLVFAGVIIAQIPGKKSNIS